MSPLTTALVALFPYLAAFAIGIFMMLSIWTRGFGGRIRTPVWYALFFVMFTLMIAMRFGY